MNTKATAILMLMGWLTAIGARAADAKPFKDEREKNSYAVGMNYGNTFKRMELDLDYNALLRGIQDASAGTNTLLNEQEMRETLMQLQQQVMEKQHEKQRLLGEKNRKEGEEFLAANKNKPGVVTLTNGLQYLVLAEGEGPSPKPEDLVTVNYRGTLIDGTEFDHSPTNQPAVFAANRVIPGWTQALTRMKAGAKWRLFIPSDLAYGTMGRPPKIGPNATLIFDVELVAFKPPAPPPAATPLTSDIIKVPSLEEMKKGAKIETIKADEVEKLQKEQKAAAEKPKQ